jgi:anti-anti-sigma factor
MKIEVARMGSVTVLSPRGAITQTDVDQFLATLEDHRRKTQGRLVVDLSQVTHFDSRGVEAIWDIADRQRETGKSMKVAAVPELCREIFDLTGLAGALDVFDSSESAVRSFL